MPQTSVTTSASEILPYDAGRKTVFFRHIGTSGIIYLSNDSTASVQTATSSWILRAGDAIAISARGRFADKVILRWTARSSTGTITIAYEELHGEDSNFDVAFLAGGQQITSATQAFEVGGVTEATQGLTGKGPFVVPRAHYSEEIVVIDNVSIPNTATAFSASEDVSDFDKVAVLVQSDVAVTVYPQGSWDNVNWFDMKTAADADLTYACSNEKISFSMPHYAKYFRVGVTNASGGPAAVTAVLVGQA